MSKAIATKEALLMSSQSLDAQRAAVEKALTNVLNGRASNVDACDGDCCTGCGYGCNGNCCGACVGKNQNYCWVRDIYPKIVVYSQDGDLYQRSYSIDSAGVVTFGDATECEIAYKTVGESHRAFCRDGMSLKEAGATFNEATGKLTLTVIQPGLNTSKTRYYPASVLKRDAAIFENAKMFVNHQTDQESRQRPEGSVNDWAAQIDKVWTESDGRIRATATVIDPPFKEKLASLQKANLLQEMGVSIRAVGVGSEAEVEDGGATIKTQMVEQLVAARSVDFVTFPGAGGRCEVLESDRSDQFDIDIIGVKELKERRGDLVELIESKARGDVERMKTIEQELAEAKANEAKALKEAEGLRTQLTEAETKTKRANAAVELSKLLEAAKLPKPAEERIRAQFKEADKVEGMKEAIDSEREYIAKIAPASGPKHLGTKANGNTEVTESDRSADEPSKEEQIKTWMSIGLTEAQAKIAVGA